VLVPAVPVNSVVIWREAGTVTASKVASAPDLAATTAGATTIPIKARAIKRSCIVFLLAGVLAIRAQKNH